METKEEILKQFKEQLDQLEVTDRWSQMKYDWLVKNITRLEKEVAK